MKQQCMHGNSLASQTLFFFFLLIGGVVGRKIIVWSNSHAKFVLHCQQYFALQLAVVGCGFFCNRARATFMKLASYVYGCSYPGECIGTWVRSP